MSSPHWARGHPLRVYYETVVDIEHHPRSDGLQIPNLTRARLVGFGVGSTELISDEILTTTESSAWSKKVSTFTWLNPTPARWDGIADGMTTISVSFEVEVSLEQQGRALVESLTVTGVSPVRVAPLEALLPKLVAPSDAEVADVWSATVERDSYSDVVRFRLSMHRQLAGSRVLARVLAITADGRQIELGHVNMATRYLRGSLDRPVDLALLGNEPWHIELRPDPTLDEQLWSTAPILDQVIVIRDIEMRVDGAP